MIYHWCPKQAWVAAENEYTPPSLAEEGFIHFSFLHQVERTATDLSSGQDGLVLLAVDDSALNLVVEDCYEIGEAYPHLYGPLPTASVVAVHPFPPGPDGGFRLPSVLEG